MPKGAFWPVHVVARPREVRLSSHFSPVLRQYLCALEGHPEGVAELVPQVQAWTQAALDSLQRLTPVVMLADSTEEFLRQARLDLLEGLRLMESSPTPEGLREVWERYYGQLFQLSQEESERPVFSPILFIDQLIKVGFNLLNGRVESFELLQRLPSARAELDHNQQLISARLALFDEVEWPREALDQAFEQLQGGLGALYQYSQTGEIAALEAGLALLSRGSGSFSQVLEQAITPKYSPSDSVESWCRLHHYAYDLEVREFYWNRLVGEGDQFFSLIQRARMAGLGIAAPETIREAGICHQKLVDALAQVSDPPESSLVPIWAEMVAFTHKIHGELSQLQQSIGGAPRLLDLVEVLGQVEQDNLPKWVLRIEIEKRLLEHQSTMESLLQAPPLAEVLLPLLEPHQAAYQRILLYLDDEQAEHLQEGWKLLSLSIPSLIAFDHERRQEVAKQGKSGQQVTCVRCGHIQKPAKNCAQCGSALPQLAIDDVRYDDIIGGSGRRPQNAADQLSDLISGLQFGTATWDQVRQELLRQYDILTKTRERFEREVVRMMGQDATLDAYCQFFVVRLGQLSQVLMTLSEAAKNQAVNVLKAHVSDYRQLHEELIEFQNRIQEGIKKGS